MKGSLNFGELNIPKLFFFLMWVYFDLGASLVARMEKNLPAMQETWVQSLGQEDPLEKEMETHSSILAWRIPWTERLGRLQPMGSQRVGRHWLHVHMFQVYWENSLLKGSVWGLYLKSENSFLKWEQLLSSFCFINVAFPFTSYIKNRI